MREREGPIDSIYLDDRIDAGDLAPGNFNPDLSFFNESFRRMTANERTVLKAYNMSTIHLQQFVVGFGGVHSNDPEGELFGKTGEAFDYFLYLINNELERATCIVEGGRRHVDPTLPDKQIFTLYGEIGRTEALAQRAGIEVVGAEPFVGLNSLAQKYDAVGVLNYLCLRLLPQWYRLDPEQRPSPNAYIVSIFRNRPYLSQLKHMRKVDSYIWSLERGSPFTLPYDIPMPSYRECLEQTTYEYIVYIPEHERTMTQQIAFEHNLQRDKRLYSDITRYLNEGRHVFVAYGDVHLRAVDNELNLIAEAMQFGRKTAHRTLRFPPS